MKNSFAHCTKTALVAGLLMAISMGAQAQANNQPADLAPPQPTSFNAPTQMLPQPSGVQNYSRTNYQNYSNMDESTLINQAIKEQARSHLKTIEMKNEKIQMDQERERMKYEQEKLEHQLKHAELQKQASSSAPVSVVPGPDGQPVVTQMPAAAAAEEEAPKPVVNKTYSFDNKWFAELVVEGAKIKVNKGSELLDGSKVTNITSDGVVLTRKGKKIILPLASSIASAKK